MNRVFLLLGSNLGSKEINIYKSRILLHKNVGTIISISDYYYSEAWGYNSENNFVNQAILLESQQDCFTLMNQIKEIEKIIGRKEKKTIHYEDRLIDIDILFYNKEIIDDEKVKVPHPLLHERLFALMPLAQIIDESFTHPLLKGNIKELIKNLNQ